MKKGILQFLLFSFCICVYADTAFFGTSEGSNKNAEPFEFSKKGSKWFGGSFNFTSMGVENGKSRVSAITISPLVRTFPADHFMIGPSFSWSGAFGGGSIHQFSLGLDIGGVFNLENQIFPYIRSGSNISVITGSSDGITGYTLPIAAGFIIPLGSIFAIQIEPAFSVTWIENTSYNIFSVNIGVCGIGKKAAVSFSQGASGQISFF